MYTWSSKPSEYGKITAAAITELKSKIESLVTDCSSAHSGYHGTYHTTTACSVTQSSICSSVHSSRNNTQRSTHCSSVDYTDYGTYEMAERVNYCSRDKGEHNDSNHYDFWEP